MWKKDNIGWWYQNHDGTYPKSQWKSINSKWYYFNQKGYLLTNTTTPDGYKVDHNGEWVEKKVYKKEMWKKDNIGWWYQNYDGTYPKSQWKSINSKWYYFNQNGYLLTNTTTPDGYKVDHNGEIIKENNTFSNSISDNEKYLVESKNGSQTVYGYYDDYEATNLRNLTNNYRNRYGKKALRYNYKLEEAAKIRARELAVLFEHKRPNGKEINTTYRYSVNALIGENIQYGPLNADEILNNFIKSNGHNRNMLLDRYTDIGTAVFACRIKNSSGEYYYNYYSIQLFGIFD